MLVDELLEQQARANAAIRGERVEVRVDMDNLPRTWLLELPPEVAEDSFSLRTLLEHIELRDKRHSLMVEIDHREMIEVTSYGDTAKKYLPGTASYFARCSCSMSWELRDGEEYDKVKRRIRLNPNTFGIQHP